MKEERSRYGGRLVMFKGWVICDTRVAMSNTCHDPLLWWQLPKIVGPTYLGQFAQPQGELYPMRHEINLFFLCDMLQRENSSSLKRLIGPFTRKRWLSIVDETAHEQAS